MNKEKDTMKEEVKVNYDSYSKLESGGLNYIRNQRHYLLLSVIVPVYCVFVQLVNLTITLYYLFNVRQFPVAPSFKRIGFVLLFDVFSPFIVLIIFSFFAILHFTYLWKWNKNVQRYEHYSRTDVDDHNVSLTSIFYDIIENMEQIRKIFIVLIVVFVFYLQWFFRAFLTEIITIISVYRHGLGPLRIIAPILNLSVQIIIALYIILNYRHFKRWSGKLSRIKNLERQIYDELESKSVLMVFGDRSELDEAMTILRKKKKDLSMKIVENELRGKEEIED
ncbi:MAG: hypothetical protein ACTSW1_13045 [Candidatus Hodarchaeales archaeon]